MIITKKVIKEFISPIQIGHQLLTHRSLYLIENKNKVISELSPLEGLHPESLEESKNQLQKILSSFDINHIINNFQNGLFDPSKIFFNLISLEKSTNLYSSVIFCLEAAILNLVFPQEHKKIPYCFLDFNLEKTNVSNGVIKIKIGRRSLDEDSEKINKYIQQTNLIIRLDGNRNMNANSMYELLKNKPSNRFQFLEDPFTTEREAVLFYSKMIDAPPLALDENLNILLDKKFKNNPLRHFIKFAIIKPNLKGGISSASKMANELREIGISSVISSSFESEIGINTLNNIHSIIPDTFANNPGLDTLKYFK